MDSEYKEVAEKLGDAKRTIAHSYMSSKVEVTTIQNDFAGIPIDSFVIKAAQSAFKYAAKTDKLNVKRVRDLHTSSTYLNV